MLKKCLTCLVSIIVLVAIVGLAACKLPTADEMRQPDYGAGVTEAETAQAVIDEIAELFDDLRAGEQTGLVVNAFSNLTPSAANLSRFGVRQIPFS